MSSTFVVGAQRPDPRFQLGDYGVLAVLLSQHLSSQGILLAAGLTYCGIVVASALTAGGRLLLAAR